MNEEAIFQLIDKLLWFGAGLVYTMIVLWLVWAIIAKRNR